MCHELKSPQWAYNLQEKKVLHTSDKWNIAVSAKANHLIWQVFSLGSLFEHEDKFVFVRGCLWFIVFVVLVLLLLI